MKTKIIKLFTGLWFLLWMLIVVVCTFPVWIILFAYDLGNPEDDKDRMWLFLSKVMGFGGFSI